MRLKSKRTIVFGVGGIGGEIARRFSEEGATVWCLDHDHNNIASISSSMSDGSTTRALLCDATRYEEVDDCIGEPWRTWVA